MSLGLVYADDKGIYLAVDGCNCNAASTDGQHCLSSKLVDLGNEVFMICTGGMTHWADVEQQYRRLGAGAPKKVEEIAKLIKTLLSSVTDTNNQAFARLCGYDNDNPLCYTIDRAQGDAEPSCKLISIHNKVVGIGMCGHCPAAYAQDQINNGMEPLNALIKVIGLSIDGVGITQPIDPRIIIRHSQP